MDRYSSDMNVSEAARTLGISERRVRAMIRSGRAKATMSNGAWQIEEIVRADRRPLSERSRALLARALHDWSVGGLKGHDLKRTAGRIRELMDSDDPSSLLRAWWGTPVFEVRNAGDSLVRSAFANDDEFVHSYLHRNRHAYLIDSESTRDAVVTMRNISGRSIADVAKAAGVGEAVVSDIERGILPDSIVSMRRILESLDLVVDRFVVADAA